MGQRVFQIARDLRIDSKIIVRKLVQENLPPPRSDQGSNGRESLWTPRSPVSVGLREVIREWHASGELLQGVLDAGEPGAAKQAKRARAGNSGTSRPAPATADGVVANQALEAVAQIDREARQKKRAQLEGLRASRTAIVREINALGRQISQIDKALQVMTIRPAGALAAPRARTYRDLGNLRERMGAWLESRRGEKFGAGALEREFPELENTAVSYVLKPLVKAGRLQTDASGGSKRPKYFAPQGAILGATALANGLS